ncbi:acetylornithine deacetylase/succinyl-diaminopimelate desuccinylase-like protein [Actinopolyspora biskrensis]|uniref:Acetylornithine deacetylase/succinyl-diaminopimelate desuccinylase-like protein n=1 Tax=Actinopolyspora biskrensis TaxID=1470178 RepID=A0A852YZG6_9ACTN|nr:acetylornithine deacetylase/succinyl-diaminopimelate desuccinylase-like protein [Actinopolyspora biskrensis]
MDHAAVNTFVRQQWDSSVVSSLSRLIEIPAVSPGFDPEWEANGQLDSAIGHVREWIEARGLTGARTEVVRLPGRSPLLLVDVPATDGASDETALLYGHLDKQPPMDGWSAGFGPWSPVVHEGRLYGRGSVDDGYSGYAAVTAIEALRAQGGRHPRCVLLLETGEESGSPDLPAYLDHLSERLGRIGLVVCLDSGGGDYERLWLTTSLRGLVQVNVTVKVLDTGQHSGAASGLVPDSFRIARQLLERLEDSATGEILLPELNVRIPDSRAAEARAGVEAAPGLVRGSVELPPGMRMMHEDEAELALNNWWRPTLTVIGADGLPHPAEAGNVLRSRTTLDLSFRLPPTADPDAALRAVRSTLERDVPYGAEVEFGHEEAGRGFNAPETAPWLNEALDRASAEVFGAGWRSMGLGGSIPFMGLLHERYPEAQFVVTGALGPRSNAHVPDESLDLDYAARVTSAVARVLDAHARK